MKRARSARSRRPAADDLRPEYRFDYRKARPNRLAGRLGKDRVVVVLDPDLSAVFTTPESVKRALRALIGALPGPTKARTVRRAFAG